jgi:hypothetical protein
MIYFCLSLGITRMKLHVGDSRTIPVFCPLLMDEVCPHSAFMDPSVLKGTPRRVSIEVRAIVIG